MNAGRGRLGMVRSGRDRSGERGQIMILFTLVIVLLMALAAIVIDVGLLRTDGARLRNALDAAALAGAHSLPANSTNYASIQATAIKFAQDNYPGLPAPTATFACLIGIDSAGNPRVTDMPTVCHVSFEPGDTRWRTTGAVAWAVCTPGSVSTDVCNTIVVEDSATRAYSFGPAAGVNSGSTGTLTSAACTGSCGKPPTVSVDVVLILDRTPSMDDSGSVANLRNGALSVLEAFDPALQRVALGFTGPTSLVNVSNGDYGSNAASHPTNTCTSPKIVHALALVPGTEVPGPAGPVPTLVGTPSWAANSSTPPGPQQLAGHRSAHGDPGRRLPAGHDRFRRRQQHEHQPAHGHQSGLDAHLADRP
jgi:hypothetical protein